jgi:O-acetyl-ADP-ribose deacetylase (regulator of RNase III)
MMKLVLCDNDPAVVAAWRSQFERHPQVEVIERSILEAEADAVVSPGNSFGFMDGGLALKFCEKFGFGIQEEARRAVRERFRGEMLVGQAEVLPTGGSPAHLIYAPVQRTGGSIADTVNVYLAFRAALAAVEEFNRIRGGEPIGKVACPGLGILAGGLHPLVSARQMRYAFEEASGLRKKGDLNLSKLARREKKLKEMPGSVESEEA